MFIHSVLWCWSGRHICSYILCYGVGQVDTYVHTFCAMVLVRQTHMFIHSVLWCWSGRHMCSYILCCGVGQVNTCVHTFCAVVLVR